MDRCENGTFCKSIHTSKTEFRCKRSQAMILVRKWRMLSLEADKLHYLANWNWKLLKTWHSLPLPGQYSACNTCHLPVLFQEY
jgi:hypothetical protein